MQTFKLFVKDFEDQMDSIESFPLEADNMLVTDYIHPYVLDSSFEAESVIKSILKEELTKNLSTHPILLSDLSTNKEALAAIGYKGATTPEIDFEELMINLTSFLDSTFDSAESLIQVRPIHKALVLEVLPKVQAFYKHGDTQSLPKESEVYNNHVQVRLPITLLEDHYLKFIKETCPAFYSALTPFVEEIHTTFLSVRGYLTLYFIGQ